MDLELKIYKLKVALNQQKKTTPSVNSSAKSEGKTTNPCLTSFGDRSQRYLYQALTLGGVYLIKWKNYFLS